MQHGNELYLAMTGEATQYQLFGAWQGAFLPLGRPVLVALLESIAGSGGAAVPALFTARRNIDSYWMDLFMSNAEIHRHHAQDVLDSFQNCPKQSASSNPTFLQTLKQPFISLEF